jgi:hypothetical protein
MTGWSDAKRERAKVGEQFRKNLLPITTAEIQWKSDMVNMTAVAAQALSEYRSRMEPVASQLGRVLLDYQEALKPISLVIAKLAQDYYANTRPLVEALAFMTTEAGRWSQQLVNIQTDILEKVADYAELHPEAVITNESSEADFKGLITEMRNEIRELKAQAEASEKKSRKIDLIFFVLSIIIPQLLWGGSPSVSKEEHEKFKTEIIQTIKQYQPTNVEETLKQPTPAVPKENTTEENADDGK